MELNEHPAKWFTYSIRAMGNKWVSQLKAALFHIFISTMDQIAMCNAKGAVHREQQRILSTVEHLTSFCSLFLVIWQLHCFDSQTFQHCLKSQLTAVFGKEKKKITIHYLPCSKWQTKLATRWRTWRSISQLKGQTLLSRAMEIKPDLKGQWILDLDSSGVYKHNSKMNAKVALLHV